MTKLCFFDATPEELGLTYENGLYPSKPFQVVKTKDTKFGTNKEVKSFMLSNLKKQKEFYEGQNTLDVEEGKESVEDAKAHERNLRDVHRDMSILFNSSPEPWKNYRSGPPSTVCQAVHSSEKVEGFYYDRREPICCSPWEFNEGQIFTVVGFHKAIKLAPGESTGPSHVGEPLPDTYPGHIGWWISYDTKEEPEKSHFSIVQYTNDPDRQYMNLGGLTTIQKIQMVLFKGTPMNDDLGLWLVAYIGAAIIHHYTKFFFVIIAMLSLWMYSKYLNRRYSLASSKQESRSEIKTLL